jgi:hypothetical protein
MGRLWLREIKDIAASLFRVDDLLYADVKQFCL